jgi:hypothetical protein
MMGNQNAAATTNRPEPFRARNRHVGQQLRIFRTRLGWHQADLADYLNRTLGMSIGQTAVSSWERGQRTVPAVVFLLCKEMAEAEVGKAAG